MEMKFPVPRHPAISSINQQASRKKRHDFDNGKASSKSMKKVSQE